MTARAPGQLDGHLRRLTMRHILCGYNREWLPDNLHSAGYGSESGYCERHCDFHLRYN